MSIHQSPRGKKVLVFNLELKDCFMRRSNQRTENRLEMALLSTKRLVFLELLLLDETHREGENEEERSRGKGGVRDQKVGIQ